MAGGQKPSTGAGGGTVGAPAGTKTSMENDTTPFQTGFIRA